MSTAEELRKERDLAIERNQFYETVLSNIANGYWNAGRAEPISVKKYAKDALRVSRLDLPSPS